MGRGPHGLRATCAEAAGPTPPRPPVASRTTPWKPRSRRSRLCSSGLFVHAGSPLIALYELPPEVQARAQQQAAQAYQQAEQAYHMTPAAPACAAAAKAGA